MNKGEQESIDSLPVESEAHKEARLSKLQADLDRHFRHAGQGNETRALYQAVFDFLAERRT
ncbi:hypothetical protein [Azonexus sp. IMCC34839]|uniref:hypothetical protein n=1 Tax=Azonexus sp. IMCC34839 TaxID=3133695 RepID=UPI00399AF984